MEAFSALQPLKPCWNVQREGRGSYPDLCDKAIAPTGDRVSRASGPGMTIICPVLQMSSLPLVLGRSWVSGIRDAALDPVHPLLGTLPILGTEVIYSLAGLELQNQMTEEWV